MLIYPAQVQGDAAAGDVIAGLRYFQERARAKDQDAGVDVIIIARGGGSAEDLAAFNHEGLARAVAEAKIPVISAIGHETDFTIVDFVADLRAPTPSAAAELVIRSRQEIEAQCEEMNRRLEHAIRYRLLMARQELTELAQHGAFRGMMDSIHRSQQKLDERRFRLEKAEAATSGTMPAQLETASAAVRHYDARRRLAAIRQQLEAQVANLTAAARAHLLAGRAALDRRTASLEALSPRGDSESRICAGVRCERATGERCGAAGGGRRAVGATGAGTGCARRVTRTAGKRDTTRDVAASSAAALE